MVWESGEEAWEAKLAALRCTGGPPGASRPRRDAVWTDPADGVEVPIGQHMANLRRKGAKNGLGKDPKRAEQRAAQLAAIDPDWDCPWPLDWQRHDRLLSDLVADEPDGVLPRTSHLAYSWTATTSASGSNSRISRPSGRGSCPRTPGMDWAWPQAPGPHGLGYLRLADR
ncbi:hypothetical protein ACF1DV_33940 [Streptomyces achromogenes]|uniref:hypothetical protein n=1 Tax=Streptomyces achromogenes TaxID=67255 RepID=UPI0036FFE171